MGEELAVLRGHTGYVWGLAFSPDGQRLASTGGHHNRGEVTIWDMSPYKPRDVKAELEEAVRRDPKSAQAHCNLGVALSAQKWLDEPIACYKKAVELEPKQSGR
jgi:WD40 repeat protein